jgi:signal transduction histidine kinase
MTSDQQPEAMQAQIKSLTEQLERVNRERIEYLQNVSHQMVAPLNAMKWHIENLTGGRVRDLERIRKVLRSVYSQATLAVHLAKNFSLMSSLESDHTLKSLREPLQPVSLSQLVVNLADDFQPLGWDKEVNIRVDDQLLKQAPPVLVIKPLISQVFSNIIENAVKYSDRLTTIMIDGNYIPERDAVIVGVHNSGIPLPHADTQRVFERGYRTTQAKSVYPAGTGFGLYIAKKIVEIHKGAIIATTGTRGQTVFCVTLPVKELAGEARERHAKDSPASRR